MILYHGSDKIIGRPEYGKGSAGNDFGRGFYCTENIELAKEWACKKNTDGFVNQYEIDMVDLRILNLNDEKYHILNWLALLTKHRGYWQKTSIAEDAKIFLQKQYLIDISDFDVILGYRADDSYFSFAQDFISGVISLQTLGRAMRLGKLGEQWALKSSKAFSSLHFLSASPVSSEEFFKKKCERDLRARRDYADMKRMSDVQKDIFIIDILRGRVTDDELRL